MSDLALSKSRQAALSEIVKCGRNPSHFINTYCMIQHPVRGLIQFNTFPYQDKCLEDFENFKFNITLKSRQLGLSTLAAAYSVWLAIFHRDKNILVIATKLPTANNFIKKVKTILANLPPWLKLPKETGNAKSEVTFDNGSQIKAIPTSDDAGRSEALSLLIVDEAAFIRDMADIWTGIWPTLSTGGRAILISTPNGTTGVGEKFYRLWTEAEAGQNDFNPIRLEWTVHPEHTPAWYEEQCRQLGDPRKIAQELLCDFQSSGETFLNHEDLEWVRTSIQTPASQEGYTNNVWVWRRPEPGRRYIISADVSRGDANDYSAFHIIDETLNVAAEFLGKLPPDRFGELLAEWGHQYNKALIAPESNTYGYMTCVKLLSLSYPHLYYKKAKGDIWKYKPAEDELPGFENQKKSRPQILSKLEEVIRNRSITIHSRRTYAQLVTFVWNNGKAQAASENHDDLVMSLAIGVWIITGDVKPDYNISHANAMLAATHKDSGDRRRFQHIDAVQPLIHGNAVQPYPIYRPNDKNASQKQINHLRNDFRWLL